jgi:hypothetical protein
MVCSRQSIDLEPCKVNLSTRNNAYPKKVQTKMKQGTHQPDGSHLSPGRDRNLESSVQGLLVRHAGPPRLAQAPHYCRQGTHHVS